MARPENPQKKQPRLAAPTRRAKRKSLRSDEQQQDQQIVNPPLDERGAAKYIGVSHGSLRGWRARDKREGTHTAPAFYTAGKLIRYRVTDLNKWVEARLSDPAAQS
jgi:hypothetical protein